MDPFLILWSAQMLQWSVWEAQDALYGDFVTERKKRAPRKPRAPRAKRKPREARLRRSVT